MKKIFFTATLLAAVYVINAQDPLEKSVAKNNNVPASISANFTAIHPGVTVISWEPMNEWWYATYKSDNNRMIHVYYNTQPYYLERNDNFIEALPVINTFVPENVITTALNDYGNDLYSITELKSAANSKEEVYQVCLIKNGVSDRVLMNGEAVVFTDINKKQKR